MASSSASNSGAMRQRKGKAQNRSSSGTAAGSSGSESTLKRSQSWHETAANHVLSRRRYFLLFGVLLGVAGVITTQIVYLDQPIEDMMPITKESVRLCLCTCLASSY